MTYYIGILDGKKDVWGVRIPDVPGCHGGGGTAEDALADAVQALRSFAADGALPAARSLEAVQADPDADFDPSTECMVLVALIAEHHQTVRANISMDAGHLAAIDAAAELQGMTRSSFLEAAALLTILQGTRESFADDNPDNNARRWPTAASTLGDPPAKRAKSRTMPRNSLAGRFTSETQTPKPARRSGKKRSEPAGSNKS